ncbi:unnamed protein product [Gordionus sp. m RMFG-2023]
MYDPLKAGGSGLIVPHDRGIVRAINAVFKPPKPTGRLECTIFVGKLSFKTKKEELRKKFSKYGDIKKIQLIKDIVTGMSKKYSFIEFENIKSAKAAYKFANDTILDNSKIHVEYEFGNSLQGWVPRRLGGGIGGNKKSGQLRFGGSIKSHKRILKLPSKNSKMNRKIYK